MRDPIQRGMSLIEILVVVAIIATLMGLLLSGIAILRRSTAERYASTTLSRLHLGLESLILELGVPTSPATGLDGSAYLDLDPVDLGGGVSTPSVAARLVERGTLSYQPDRDVDGQRRLIDPWGQPYLLVVGEGLDPNGHQPQAVAMTRREWIPVNADAAPGYRIYVYSYGRGNRKGSATLAWRIFGGDR